MHTWYISWYTDIHVVCCGILDCWIACACLRLPVPAWGLTGEVAGGLRRLFIPILTLDGVEGSYPEMPLDPTGTGWQPWFQAVNIWKTSQTWWLLVGLLGVMMGHAASASICTISFPGIDLLDDLQPPKAINIDKSPISQSSHNIWLTPWGPGSISIQRTWAFAFRRLPAPSVTDPAIIPLENRPLLLALPGCTNRMASNGYDVLLLEAQDRFVQQRFGRPETICDFCGLSLATGRELVSFCFSGTPDG